MQMQTLTTGTDCDYWYLYDANGNVGQLLWYRPAEAVPVGLAAAYEYDPYGNTLRASDEDGSGIAAANKFRFSTKWLHDELTEAGQPGALDTTGLYCYGYRYYSPNLGRWISRDPIGEEGGTALYGFVANGPTNRVDFLGEYGAETHNVLTARLAREHRFRDQFADLLGAADESVDGWFGPTGWLLWGLDWHFNISTQGGGNASTWGAGDSRFVHANQQNGKRCQGTEKKRKKVSG